MKTNYKIVFVFIVLIVTFSYLVFTGIQEGSMYYLEVSEFVNKKETLAGKKVRINGRVVKKTLHYNPSQMLLSFELADTKTNDRLKVLYHGTPPDLINKEGITTVAEGYYDRKSNVFIAKQLLIKCPSKYERKESNI